MALFMNFVDSIYTRPPTRPIAHADKYVTLLQGAVIATSPAKIEFMIFEGSFGTLYYAVAVENFVCSKR